MTVQTKYTNKMQEKYLLQMLLQVPSLPGEVWGPAEVGGEDCRIVCAGGEVRVTLLSLLMSEVSNDGLRLPLTAQSLLEPRPSSPPFSTPPSLVIVLQPGPSFYLG